MANHPFVHIEISAQDQTKSAEFYREVFGWETEASPEMNYTTFKPQEGIGGGFNPVSPEYPAGTVMVYIGTDDIEASLRKIEECGGKTLMPQMEIPGVGWFALFLDPGGNRLALFKEIMK